jgi:polyphosphate glucokinase
MKILGIDIGGSGMKAAIVDTELGTVISERYRIPTPKPSKPKLLANAVKEIIEHFQWSEVVGVSFPTVVVKSKALSGSNLGEEWKDKQINNLFHEKCGNHFFVLNDADAAGMAEMRFGAGRDKKGLVMIITIGTGLGSGVFFNGELIPNFELGRLYGKDGRPIEFYAADSARKREKLNYEKWGKRFDFFLKHLVRNFRPDLFILGGGASKKYDLFKEFISIKTPILVAEKRNNAGIIGAACFAHKRLLTIANESH